MLWNRRRQQHIVGSTARRKQHMSTLERAIVIAAEAHAGQVDKAGAPYVLHPLRMMLRVSSLDKRIVAGVEFCIAG
jgi:(p)ppGpp synthase/HD superfamily hydrolase